MQGLPHEPLDLPPIDQIAYVVRDMDLAIERFTPLFGPFGVMEVALTGVWYRGRTCDCRIKLGIGRSGPLEIELIELLDGEALYSEFLEQGREGPHHVRMTVGDLDATVERCATVGMTEVFSGDLQPMPVRFSYLEAPDLSIVELIELGRVPAG